MHVSDAHLVFFSNPLVSLVQQQFLFQQHLLSHACEPCTSRVHQQHTCEPCAATAQANPLQNTLEGLTNLLSNFAKLTELDHALLAVCQQMYRPCQTGVALTSNAGTAAAAAAAAAVTLSGFCVCDHK